MGKEKKKLTLLVLEARKINPKTQTGSEKDGTCKKNKIKVDS